MTKRVAKDWVGLSWKLAVRQTRVFPRQGREKTSAQLSSLTWTLVFQTQRNDSSVPPPSPNLNCATHKISLLFIRTWEPTKFSKFCDTIVETVHCARNSSLFSLSRRYWHDVLFTVRFTYPIRNHRRSNVTLAGKLFNSCRIFRFNDNEANICLLRYV